MYWSGGRNVRNNVDETKGNPVSRHHMRELHFCISAEPLKNRSLRMNEVEGWTEIVIMCICMCVGSSVRYSWM